MPDIAVVHYTAPTKEMGGVESVIEHHIQFLSEWGYQIRLFFGSGGGIDLKNVTEHKIPLLWPNHPTILRIQEEILHNGESSEFEAVKKEIKEDLSTSLKGVNVSIVHNIPSMPFNFAATAAINEVTDGSKRVIFWIHDSALLREEWSSKKDKFPMTLLHHKAENIRYVTLTNVRAKELSNLDNPYKIEKAIVVPNGVNIEEFIKIDETTKLLMKKLGLSFEDYIIICPVRVTPRKNIELALFVVDELQHLISTSKQIKFLITGPPDHQASKLGMAYLDYLKELIERRGLTERVFFCHELINHEREYSNGNIQKWSVADVYNIADLVFIPSKEEGFGLPVIEAGAARKPIFCSRIPPFQELIRDDIEGYMFDLQEDPKSIAFKIYRLYLEDRVDNNFDNVIKRFTWDSIIRKKLVPLL
ncbi:MAG: glycosyltransferase family 4 protein [Candidatus Bathyarchaeia archaeon]